MGADGSDWQTGLCADLRQVRLRGIPRSRTMPMQRLRAAAEFLGHRTTDLPVDLAIEALLRQAVGRLGESPDADAAARTFGLHPGLKMAKAADRRRAAARVQGVTVETFRKSYEPALIEQVAAEIAGLLSRLGIGDPAAPGAQDRPPPEHTGSPVPVPRGAPAGPHETPDQPISPLAPGGSEVAAEPERPTGTAPETADLAGQPTAGRTGSPARAGEIGPLPAPTFAKERHVADILRIAHANADWDLVEGVYRQCTAIAEDHQMPFVPEELPSTLAKAFGRISANYHRREEELLLHGLGILGNAEHADRISPALFAGLYRDARFDRLLPYGAPTGFTAARRPRPFETLVETARRYRDLNHLHGVLADLPTTCILGGSLNYGRYFSVRGATDSEPASNVDIMLVIPDFGWLDEVLSGVSTLPGCARASLTALERRARLWREHRLDDGGTVFTQRLLMWSDCPDPLMAWAPNPGEYAIDLRVASVDTLDWLLVADTPKLTAAGAGNTRPVRDFCQWDRGADDQLRGFSGRSLRVPLEADKVEDSLVLTHRAYSIHDDRYHPGCLQGLILPRFNKRWDNAPIGGKLETFRWKIIERLRYERRDHPYEVLRVSLSHTRGDRFAPHILSSIDSGDTL
jgi:hypothetical protein